MTIGKAASNSLIPLKLLEELADKKANGYLKAVSGGITWFIYFTDGKIFYASHSIEPLDRLEFHTRQILGHRTDSSDWQIFDTWRLRIANTKLDDFYPSYDYQAIHSLVKKNIIQQSDATKIIKGITKEVIQSFLLLQEANSKFITEDSPSSSYIKQNFPISWSVNFLSINKECQDEIDAWKEMTPVIYSSYQRPYIIKHASENFPAQYAYLQKFLVGVDFHQLSLKLHQPAIEIARIVRQLVVDKVVGLHAPKPPFNKLPSFATALDNAPTGNSVELATTKLHKIVCVDDSPAILRQMHIFLDVNTFDIIPVVDAAAAITKIIQVKPQVILMDIDMPNIDGYQLCAMVRKNPAFKTTPIVMVTSNSGLIDRARAKLSGATDYMTKPFSQAGLNEMVTKYIVDRAAQ